MISSKLTYANIGKLDRITDEMIVRNTMGYSTRFNTAYYNEVNTYNRKFDYFHGIQYLFSLDTEKDLEIALLLEIQELENYKLVLILPDETIIPITQEIETYFLPKGSSKIVLVGSRAKGSFSFQIEPQEGLTIKRWGTNHTYREEDETLSQEMEFQVSDYFIDNPQAFITSDHIANLEEISLKKNSL